MSLSGSQIMKLRRYGIRLIIWGLVAFVGFKAYQSFQEARIEGQKNRVMKAAYEKETVLTDEERAKINALPEERKKGRSFVKSGGSIYSFPAEYYFNQSMMIHWTKGNNYYGARGKGQSKVDDETIRIYILPSGRTDRQGFDSLLESNFLIKEKSPQLDMDVYVNKSNNNDIERYYVLRGFKDVNGGFPVARCGSKSARSDDGFCVIGVQLKSNIYLAMGDMTAKHVDDWPEIYQAIMSVANQIEDIK
ncbi:hypothetical protein DTO96_100423 [Ephemeroptericola cinctiostellae]|uniref:Uncharacterized protein n=1 Tax=Ephemeroptericola cinctiostellae TaxID=2268024 RepID=A0A345D8M5_9BURK|nr:hypothetical protein [Ephemeroptericola cinctiostellae]AXF84713.1 hypothetical protein DTO96_100423 [Ephemeroptericola cinctiostellae]